MAAGQTLRGFVGQSMSGKKPVRLQMVDGVITTAAGSGVLTAPAHCQALIYLMGPGSAGLSGGVASGSGGGAALFKRMWLNAGQQLSWTCGQKGIAGTEQATNTTVTLPGGQVLIGGAGKIGIAGGINPGGKGGVAVGGDTNRNGGDGGASDTGTSGSAGQTGQGQGAGLGGAFSNTFGGGGGGAGLADLSNIFTAGSGSAANQGGGSAAGGDLGGGGGAASGTGGAGGLGKVAIVLVRVN